MNTIESNERRILQETYACVNAAINSAMREIDNGAVDNLTLRNVLEEVAWCIAHWAENLETFEHVVNKAKLELVKTDK